MQDRSSNLALWIVGALVLVAIFRHSDVGGQAPDFTLTGAYGGEYHLNSFHGQPLLLVFWSTSCGICRHELPILDGLSSEAARNGVEIAAVNVGDLEGARQILRPLHLLNLVDVDGNAARDYGVSGVPKLVLIGADGKIKHSVAGAEDEDTLRTWLRRETP